MHIPLVIGAAAIPLMGLPLLFLSVHIVWPELVIHATDWTLVAVAFLFMAWTSRVLVLALARNAGG